MPPRVPDARWLWENEPCRAACPVHTDAGAYVTAIAEGRYRDAYLIARGPNPFASICGRVCAAPCESACRRGTLDAAVSIRALKRFVTERFGVESFSAATVWHEAHGPVPPATGPSVGVIGGGPAGLSAAHDLRLAGHPVTVYEANERLGGMMVLGIPEYRLSRGVISREIEAILEMGVEAHTGFSVGRDASLRDLLGRHDALFLAVGTGRARDLDLPGKDLDGVFRAIEYLLNVNQGFRVDLGERVVVIGGGNVAFDAARTALRAAATSGTEALPGPAPVARQTDDDARRAMTTTLDVARAAVRAGVRSVTVVALESADEIPADPEEIEEAEREGITIVYRQGPHRFVGETRVTGLETIAVASVFDADGRFAPKFVPGTEAVIPADAVILAVGQGADLSLLGDVELEQTPQGGVRVDPDTLQTSDARIWAGGDVAKGPRNLIDAIADGQRAAARSTPRCPVLRPSRPRSGSRSAGGRASVASTAATTRSRAWASRRRRPTVGSGSPRSRSVTTSRRLSSKRCAACAASTTSCSTRGCASCAGSASTSAPRTASPSCGPTASVPVLRPSRHCSSTRTVASGARCA